MPEIKPEDTLGTTEKFSIYVPDSRADIVSKALRARQYLAMTTRGDFIHHGDIAYEQTMDAVAAVTLPDEKLIEHFEPLIEQAKAVVENESPDKGLNVNYKYLAAQEFLRAVDEEA